ncbi:MAG: DVUA0089 family protein [Planctomycetes bacterium]|nr:DVUA0089 family protein [Planctomycetota bacterium]
MFSFSVAAGQRVGFDIDRPSGILDSYVRLFDGAGKQLAFNDDGPNPAEPSSQESYLEYTFNTAGTYYLGVSGYPNRSYNSVTGDGDVNGKAGPYTLILTPLDLDDQIAEAISLGAINQTQTRTGESISFGIDVDVFSFSVVAGQRIGFDIDRPSGSLDSYVRLFDSAGNQLASNDDGPMPGEPPSLESYLEYTFSSAGTYYLGVSGYPNRSYNAVTGGDDVSARTGAYTLILNPLDLDDQISEATALGPMTQTLTRSGETISIGTDVDVFSFSVAAGQRIAFDIDRPSGSLNSLLRLFDSNGTQLAVNDDGAAPGESSGVESYAEYTFHADGTYYVGVSGAPNSSYDPVAGDGDVAGSTGAYALALIPIDLDDQISEAIALGPMTRMQVSTSQSINIGMDVDVFSFSVVAGQRIAFDIDRPSGTLNSHLRLFDGNGNQLASNDDGPTPGEGSSVEPYLEYSFGVGGTYYVGVSGSPNSSYDVLSGEGDASGSTGPYALTLSVIPMFQIDLTFSGLTATQRVIFNQAADRWEQIIVGDVPEAVYRGQTVDDILIDASARLIDGPGKILGQASVDARRSGSSLPYHGFMSFDTADMAEMETSGELYDVILHEIGHVLGFGTIWSYLGLLSGAGGPDPRFTGSHATAAYNAVFGVSESSVPVENVAGPGSRDSHWREQVFVNELMSPFVGTPPNPLSRVTAASMLDLGYAVILEAADAYTPPKN